MARQSGAQRIWDVFLSAATLLLAALLIVQCADIYRLGTSPENIVGEGVFLAPVFSRAIVAQRLSSVAWAFWLWLAALCAAIIRRIVRPEGKPFPAPAPLHNRLEILQARTSPSPAMLAEQQKRRVAVFVCIVVCAALCAPAVIYLLHPDSFASRETEAVMSAMLLHVGPWLLLVFAALMALEQFLSRSMQREIAAAKDAPKRSPQPRKARKNTKTNALRIALLLAATALIAAGIANGGMHDVLVKAVNICTECIGLG